jgi:DNA-binding XRE family transcriptional regulator
MMTKRRKFIPELKASVVAELMPSYNQTDPIPLDFSSSYLKYLKKLRQVRLEAGLTQVEVAQMLGKPQSYVSKCESGERRVDFVELLDYAKLYQKSLDYFRP